MKPKQLLERELGILKNKAEAYQLIYDAHKSSITKERLDKTTDLIRQYENALVDLPDRSSPDSEGGL